MCIIRRNLYSTITTYMSACFHWCFHWEVFNGEPNILNYWLFNWSCEGFMVKGYCWDSMYVTRGCREIISNHTSIFPWFMFVHGSRFRGNIQLQLRWSCNTVQVEQYFTHCNILLDKKLSLGSLYLDVDDLNWYC